MLGTQVGIGISHHRNPVVAATEAVHQAKTNGSVQHPDFVLLFSMVGYRQDLVLAAVHAETGNVPLVGCSGAGIISTSIADESNFGLVVMLLQSDEICIHHGVVRDVSVSSHVAGQTIGTDVRSHLADDTAVLFLFADGIAFNFDEFLRGLGDLSVQGRSLPIIGGAAGDNLAYEKTYQYYDGELLSQGAVWATFSGPVDVISAVSHGCVPIGKRLKITKCAGNVIYEVDHKPILDVLKDYLHDDEIHTWDKAAVNLGLAFAAKQNKVMGSDYYMRCMLAKDMDIGGVILQTEVKQDDEFWVSRRDFDKILVGARTMAASIIAQLGDKTPYFILQVECDGRGKTMLRTQEKLAVLDVIQSTLGHHIPWIGLYAFGEIAPIEQENHIHNLTSIITAVC